MVRLHYKSINEKQKRKTAVYAIIGGSIIVSLLLLTSIWVSSMARAGTSQAVSRVSEFYLEELAGRRAEVVSEELKNGFAYMKNALEILDESDLESEETLQEFLGKVKKL